MHHAPGELQADTASGARGAGGSPAGLHGAWDGSEVAGRLEALRSLLSQPDRLWEQFLTEAGRVLPLRQYGVAGATAESPQLRSPLELLFYETSPSSSILAINDYHRCVIQADL